MTRGQYDKMIEIINDIKSIETTDTNLKESIIKKLEAYLEDLSYGFIKPCSLYSFTPNN